MLEDLTLAGYWFLPGSEDRVPGTFSFTPTKGIRLDLNGVLTDAFPSQTPSDAVIFGETSTGKSVTLSRCFMENSNISFPGYGLARYYAQFAFIGAHLPEAEHSQFPLYRVRVWNLEEFLGVDPFRIQWNRIWGAGQRNHPASQSRTIGWLSG